MLKTFLTTTLVVPFAVCAVFALFVITWSRPLGTCENGTVVDASWRVGWSRTLEQPNSWVELQPHLQQLTGTHEVTVIDENGQPQTNTIEDWTDLDVGEWSPGSNGQLLKGDTDPPGCPVYVRMVFMKRTKLGNNQWSAATVYQTSPKYKLACPGVAGVTNATVTQVQ